MRRVDSITLTVMLLLLRVLFLTTTILSGIEAMRHRSSGRSGATHTPATV